jgi:hypothetical protein
VNEACARDCLIDKFDPSKLCNPKAGDEGFKEIWDEGVKECKKVTDPTGFSESF